MEGSATSDKPNNKKPLCFVIRPIGKSGTEVRKHADLLLNSVIKQVLESVEFGYHVKRADEDADPGMIGDRMIADILHAQLVVADLTDLNPNAFYELGIRHATVLPTIHVARDSTQLPFDNISHRTIFIDLTDWNSTESGRKRLADAARMIQAPNYQVSNPVTQANANFKMRESADPKERVIIQLQERIASIESNVHKTNKIGQSLVYVDTRKIFAPKGGIFNLQYSEKLEFGDLLDNIYSVLHSIYARIKAFKYDSSGISWEPTDRKLQVRDRKRALIPAPCAVSESAKAKHYGYYLLVLIGLKNRDVCRGTAQLLARRPPSYLV